MELANPFLYQNSLAIVAHNLPVFSNTKGSVNKCSPLCVCGDVWNERKRRSGLLQLNGDAVCDEDDDE